LSAKANVDNEDDDGRLLYSSFLSTSYITAKTMCFIVQRRLTTLIRILVAVGFLVFIMCKCLYFYATLSREAALRTATRLHLSVCLLHVCP